MPAKNPIKTIDLKGFTGGLNRDADPYQLEITESPDALDVDFGLRGAVSKRDGYSRFDSPPVAATFRRIVAWERQGGSIYNIAVTDAGDIYEDSGAALTDSTKNVGGSSEDQFHIGVASLANKVYLTSINTGNAPSSFDGTTWASVTATVFDGTASRFPHARHIVTKHDRIFATNVDDAGTRHRSRLHWSNVLLPETWDAADFIDFDPDDGTEIQALAAFGEDLIVFKDRSIQLLAGRSEDSFTRYVVDSGIGTVSPMSVVPMGNLLVFFDRDRGVFGFDGSGFEKLSDKINDYLLDGINYSEAYRAKCFVRRSRLYVSVPWGSDAFNSRTFVWDQRLKAWTEYSFGVADAASNGSAWYGVAPLDDAGVFTLFATKDNDGVAFTPHVRTAWLSPEGPESKSRIRRLDLAFTAIGDIDVDVDMYRDFQGSSAYKSQVINTDPGSSLWDTAVWDVDTWDGGVEQLLSRTTGWGARFRTVQFKFSVNAAGEDFQLNRMTMHVSSLDRVRGEA